jgi:glycosyltransferase involved in cell wall biosynthesis
MLGDTESVEKLRQAAARRAREHYSWAAVTEQYEKLFWNLLVR